MGALKPRDEFYAERLVELNGSCAFCLDVTKDLLIQSFSHWVWMYNEFPYWKYHTMLVPKRHVVSFGELTLEELAELESLESLAEERYIKNGVVGIDSQFGTQLVMFWRRRILSGAKQSVEHLHLHIAPEFEHAWDTIVEEDAWDIDIDLLRSTPE